MSRAKAAKILALEGADKHIWFVKRGLLRVWRELSRDEWLVFCTKMGNWFLKQAPDEWDKYHAANLARKAKSDKAALEKVIAARQRPTLVH